MFRNTRAETTAPAKVYLDDADHLIKVSCSRGATAVGRFGNSILYKWGDFNFHPRAYEILTKIDKLKFREDDIILTMFPKSGSTWLSECIYLIVNQYQYKAASEESIEYRFPQIDSPSHDVFDLIIGQYNDPNRHRMIKASVPPNLLVSRPQQKQPSVKPRVISILRNPRDVLVSFYHHCKTVKHYDIDFDFNEFYDTFVAGRVPCGPIWLMYNEMYKYHCDNPRTSMLVYYEDMKKDLRTQIKRICKFLGKAEPANEDAWCQLIDHLSVDRMRQNRTINRHDWDQLGLRNSNGFEFIRKGQVNDWKNFFNEEQSLRFDREITDRLLPELKARYGHQQY
jgi:hypothetical protein